MTWSAACCVTPNRTIAKLAHQPIGYMSMAKKGKSLSLFQSEAEAVLRTMWNEVLELKDLEASRDDELSDTLYELITKSGSTYPFMLATQLLGKATNPGLNALCIQDSSELDGAWDARSLASKIVTRWNDGAGKPFPGTNNDPYVNNPARYKSFGGEMASKAGNRHHYELLSSLVSRAQAGGAEEASRLLKLALVEARRFLESDKRDYFGPPRASVDGIMRVLAEFLDERSNGVRLQVVCYAVYLALSEEFDGIGEVTSASTNASDITSSRTGDIECKIAASVRLAIEVKDRQLTLHDVESTALKARKNGVANVLFVVQAKSLVENPDEVRKRIAREFARGVDLNIVAATSFLLHSLTMLSPEQRAAVLRKTHDALHEHGAHYKHVQTWMTLLKSL